MPSVGSSSRTRRGFPHRQRAIASSCCSPPESARCLCGKPRLVLLDEPTEGIQPSIIDEIVETLQRLRGNSGLTMILVEQNLDFIAALSQRILVIQKGRITQEVKPDDLHDASVIGEFIGINA